MSKNKKVFGVIYCATNIINDKKYIGQTILTMHRRKTQHLWYAKNNSELPFHRAIRKYGEDNFDWNVIDEGYNRKDLDNKEIKWINKHNTFNEDGYNASTGGQIGMSDNPDEMSKMRGGKKFLVFDLDGNFITEAFSQKSFAKEYNLNYKCVNFVLNDIKHSTEGYIMIFKDEFNEEELLNKIRKSRNREFYVFSKKDRSFMGKWDDRKQCAKDIDVTRGTITKKLETNNFGNRCKYLFYFYKDLPKQLKDVI